MLLVGLDMRIKHTEIIDNKSFKIGWSLDPTYKKSRIVFRKIGKGSDSACFIYNKCDLKDHLDSCCLTNLEYLEGQEFYQSFLNIKEYQK